MRFLSEAASSFLGLAWPFQVFSSFLGGLSEVQVTRGAAFSRFLGSAEAQVASMREIAVLAEAEVARAREIAVFAEAPGGPAEAERASVREIAVFAEAQVASVREIAVFAEAQVAPAPKTPNPREASEPPTRTEICI